MKHVLHSAFSHSGQKCSATSLLLLDAEVYDDPEFKRMLIDAVRSLRVGSAHDLASRVGPLIREPSGVLETALKTLEPGESWAVMPRQVGDNARLWSPGVKYGVQPGGVTHRTEFFGPVLGVMRYERLADAIDMVNATGYGLTGAIHSLDEREIAQWKAGVQVGNLYINRGTTGAIVLRQPFGGMGLSSVGPGMKAGGPNYVACFMDFVDVETDRPADRKAIENADLAALAGRFDVKQPEEARLVRTMASYDRAWRAEFSREHDHLRLLGQDNIRRYLPWREVLVRIEPNDSLYEVFARVAAARVTGARVLASYAPGTDEKLLDRLDAATESWAAGIEIMEETDEELIAHIDAATLLRVRYAARERVGPEVRTAAAQRGHWIADVPVVGEGRVELLWYVREQSISYDYHRYGNLGVRADEPRRAVE
ncbi:MAG: aldehyde dehydrogenase family protein [Pirellulales bacterium]